VKASAKFNLIVILNDNNMSIAKPVGAMKSYLAKLFSGRIYFNFRETIKLIISSFSKIKFDLGIITFLNVRQKQ